MARRRPQSYYNRRSVAVEPERTTPDAPETQDQRSLPNPITLRRKKASQAIWRIPTPAQGRFHPAPSYALLGGALPGGISRLALERRRGKLLAVVQGRHHVIPDDMNIPKGVTRNASSAAQALAEAPNDWFDQVVDGVASGVHRPRILHKEEKPCGEKNGPSG